MQWVILLCGSVIWRNYVWNLFCFSRFSRNGHYPVALNDLGIKLAVLVRRNCKDKKGSYDDQLFSAKRIIFHLLRTAQSIG